MSNVEEVTSSADKAKVGIAVALAVAGIVAYYYFSKQHMAARVGMVLVGIIAGAAVAWTSGPGQRLVAFLKDAIAEAKRVTWPTRKEAVNMTLIVFAFSVLAALLLWGIDALLEWIIYGLLLRWK
jgi:preprotein translocase subunit SecE